MIRLRFVQEDGRFIVAINSDFIPSLGDTINILHDGYGLSDDVWKVIKKTCVFNTNQNECMIFLSKEKKVENNGS